MRVLKARSNGTQPPVRAPKVRSYGTRPVQHDRAGTFASLLYKAEKPSVRPSAVFWLRGSLPWMQGLTSNLHETKRLSSGITKFIFESLKSPSNGHRRAIKTTCF